MPIGQIIEWLADQDPTGPALTFEGTTLTRHALEQRTNRLARAYQALGVVENDLVTIALPNGLEFLEVAIATWKLGATPQPISHRLPQLEREAIVALADSKIVVGATPGSLGQRTVLAAGFEPDPDLPDTPLPPRVARHWRAPTSGGSTGRPKLILSGFPGQFDPTASAYRIQPNGVQLIPGPLYHNAPFTFAARGLFLGNHVIVLPKFDPKHTLECVERYRVDYTLLVPTMMHRIWRLEPTIRDRFDLSSLQVMLHLAAPCPPWLKAAWIDWLGPERIHELYGGTEAQATTWITGTEWLSHRGSVGRAQVGGQIKIVGTDGQELPAGEVGEVYMLPDTGPGTTYRYLGAEPKRLGDWESLGDIGSLDPDGYLYLADRQTDMILRGGANVYPAEVEAAIEAHPAVRSSAVIGLPEEALGQRVHAIIDAPGGVTETELLAHLALHLVQYKIPQSFEFVLTPVRDDAGKVRRSALRAQRIDALKAAAS
ncbi:MAG: acid--CoA ligase [Gammaproteobacteria bacterium]|nr:acid--CoA ligase [Gammaproteobacteria bacterium]